MDVKIQAIWEILKAGSFILITPNVTIGRGRESDRDMMMENLKESLNQIMEN